MSRTRQIHPPRPFQRTLILPLVLVAFLASPLWNLDHGTARAAGDDTIISIARSTVYGALTGLLLGGVTALVVEKENRDDSVRWGIVIGAFAGFGYGIYSSAVVADDDFFIDRPDPGFSWQPEEEVRILVQRRFPTALRLGSPADRPDAIRFGRARTGLFAGLVDPAQNSRDGGAETEVLPDHHGASVSR